MKYEVIHVTSNARVIALRQAQLAEKVIDVVNDEGETIRARVLSVVAANDQMWRVEVAHVR